MTELGNGEVFDLGRSGSITCYVSDDKKKLLISFSTRPEGLSKTGINGVVEVLKKMREKMVR